MPFVQIVFYRAIFIALIFTYPADIVYLCYHGLGLITIITRLLIVLFVMCVRELKDMVEGWNDWWRDPIMCGCTKRN